MQKIFLILYPLLENSTTRIAISQTCSLTPSCSDCAHQLALPCLKRFRDYAPETQAKNTNIIDILIPKKFPYLCNTKLFTGVFRGWSQQATRTVHSNESTSPIGKKWIERIY